MGLRGGREALLLCLSGKRTVNCGHGEAKGSGLTKIEDAMIACLFFGFLTCLAPAPAPPVGGRQTTVYSSCMIASGNKLNTSVVTGSATSAGNRM